jgi:four helix bundle suffix protein
MQSQNNKDTHPLQPAPQPAASEDQIILPHGGCRKLAAYKKSETILLGTRMFCERFLPKFGDRTVDQMVQAARSGKQNIIEGSAAAAVSKETEIKLTGVAKASLDELLADYEDYLREHNLQIWLLGEERLERLRIFCRSRNDWPQYCELFKTRSDEELCNLQICLIRQTQRLLAGMLVRQEEQFKQLGGIRERMSAARNATRGNDWYRAVYSYLKSAGSNEARRERAEEIHRAVNKLTARVGQ